MYGNCWCGASERSIDWLVDWIIDWYHYELKTQLENLLYQNLAASEFRKPKIQPSASTFFTESNNQSIDDHKVEHEGSNQSIEH